MNKKSLKLKSYSLYIELTRILFPAESTNDIKIEITHHRSIEDGCIWEEISLMNACWVSQSVLHQYLKAVSDGLFKNIFNGEIIFHLKRYWKGSIIAS